MCHRPLIRSKKLAIQVLHVLRIKWKTRRKLKLFQFLKILSQNQVLKRHQKAEFQIPRPMFMSQIQNIIIKMLANIIKEKRKSPCVKDFLLKFKVYKSSKTQLLREVMKRILQCRIKKHWPFLKLSGYSQNNPSLKTTLNSGT